MYLAQRRMTSQRYVFVFLVCMTIFLVLSYVIYPSCLVTCSCMASQSSRDLSHGVNTAIHDDRSTMATMYPIPGRGVYIHAAYLDTRLGTPFIHMYGIQRNDSSVDDLMCEWNSTTGHTWQVRATWQQIDPEWPQYNKYLAIMITCQLPRDTHVTASHTVHLAPSGGQGVSVPVHTFQSMYSRRHTLAVCVKPITGEFTVSRVTEWAELNLVIGYQHFILYDTDTHGASRFVLDYYTSKDVMTVIRFPFLTAILEMAERHTELDGGLRYALYQQVYLVALHDCLHRFQPSFKYLAMIDMDEVIIPAHNVTITDVISKARDKLPDVASYMFYTSWHFQEFSKPDANVPEFLYMQRFAGSATETLDQPKSILQTDRVLTVNWHGVIHAVDNIIIPRYLLGAWDYACVHHYRSGTCSEHFHELCPNMTSSVKVRQEVTRYRHVTEKAVSTVLNHLQLR